MVDFRYLANEVIFMENTCLFICDDQVIVFKVLLQLKCQILRLFIENREGAIALVDEVVDPLEVDLRVKGRLRLTGFVLHELLYYVT